MWKLVGIDINDSYCIQCDCCLNFCSNDAILPGDPYYIDVYTCILCGSCIDECSNGAILANSVWVNDIEYYEGE